MVENRIAAKAGTLANEGSCRVSSILEFRRVAEVLMAEGYVLDQATRISSGWVMKVLKRPGQ